MLVYILGAIFLMGLLVVLVRGSSTPGSGIDAEQLTLRASQVQRYTNELERAVAYILRNGASESDIRFANPSSSGGPYGDISVNPSAQVFDVSGGGATYREPPEGINDGTAWQFYATTHIKDLGTDTAASMRAELIAVLPNVTENFCDKMNDLNDQDLDLSAGVFHDPNANGCIHAGSGSEFTGTYSSGATTNTIDDTLFTFVPAKQACVRCESDDALHFYHVLMSR